MKKGNCLAAGFVALALLISSCNSKNEPAAGSTPPQVIDQLNESAKDKNNMQSEIDAYKLQVDQMKTQLSKTDSVAALKDARIAALQKDVKRYKKNSKKYAAELKKANGLIAKLKDENRNYVARIDMLRNDKDIATRQRDSAMQQYLSIKELASVLHISNMRLLTLNLKHHGKKEKKTVKARKVKIMRVIFDIDDNRIAESGTKKLYIVIKGPDGGTLSNNYGSGEMNTSNGQSIKYSVEKDVNLQKNEPIKAVTTDWKQNDEVAYKRGAYSIEVYNGGYEIGSGKVYLN